MKQTVLELTAAQADVRRPKRSLRCWLKEVEKEIYRFPFLEGSYLLLASNKFPDDSPFQTLKKSQPNPKDRLEPQVLNGDPTHTSDALLQI